MNIFKAAYCRVFQIGMRAALPILPYREPKILSHTDQAVQILKEKKKSSVLLVTDSVIRGLGLTKELEEELEAQGLDFVVYDRVQPNPTVQNVEEARELYIDNKCQAIIAFGGGSAMDCAKGCGARIARPRKPIAKMKGILKIILPTPLIIAVPTTAGTGSEATVAAVIMDPETKFKYPVNDFPLIPKYAVLQPDLTVGLPPFITATTGMDALTHAVEAYIGRSTNALTRRMSEKAVKLIFNNIYKAYKQGDDLKAREKMLTASYCAGVSFTRSYVGYVHGIAHSLGGQYGVAHGLANAVILPLMLDEYGPAIYKKLGRLSKHAGISPLYFSDKKAAKHFIKWIKLANEKMGIPTTIPEIQEEDIPIMAEHADKESNPLYPVPVLMDKRELESIYKKLMEKTE